MNSENHDLEQVLKNLKTTAPSDSLRTRVLRSGYKHVKGNELKLGTNTWAAWFPWQNGKAWRMASGWVATAAVTVYVVWPILWSGNTKSTNNDPQATSKKAVNRRATHRPKNNWTSKRKPLALPMFRGNPAHTGYYPGGLLKLKSNKKLGTVFVCAAGGAYGLDARTGKVLWDFPGRIGGYFNSSPAVVEDVVYVGALGHTFSALDAKTGKEIWTFETGSHYYSGSPTVVDGKAYIGVGLYFYALNAQSGEEIWRSPGGGHSMGTTLRPLEFPRC